MRSKRSAQRGMDDNLKARKEENNYVGVRLFLITFLIGNFLIIMTLILPASAFMLFHSILSMFSLISLLLTVILLLFPLIGFLRINNVLLSSAIRFCEWSIVYSCNASDHKESNRTDHNYLITVSTNNRLDKINLIALCLYRYGQNIEGFKGFCYSFCCQFAQDLVNSFHNVDVFISRLVKGVSISLEHQDGRYVGDTRTIINRLNSASIAADKNILSCSSVEGDGCNEQKGESCEGMQCDENHYGDVGLIQFPCDCELISKQKEGDSLYSSDNDYEVYACEGIANPLQVCGE